MSWVMKLVFRMWKGINESNKFIQLFQVDVIRGAQSDSKQQFRMNLAMKLIDMSSCVFVYANTSIWRSIHTDVIRHTLAFQYARLNWAMMLIFLYGWPEQKQKRILISSGSTAWFSTQGCNGVLSVRRRNIPSPPPTTAGEILKMLVGRVYRFSVCSRLSWSWILSCCKKIHPKQKIF